MDSKSASILGVCLIIASAIVSLRSSKGTEPVQPKIIVQHTTGRFHISSPGEKGYAFVIDTENGRVWRDVVGMSGDTSGKSFYDGKLTED